MGERQLRIRNGSSSSLPRFNPSSSFHVSGVNFRATMINRGTAARQTVGTGVLPGMAHNDLQCHDSVDDSLDTYAQIVSNFLHSSLMDLDFTLNIN